MLCALRVFSLPALVAIGGSQETLQKNWRNAVADKLSIHFDDPCACLIFNLPVWIFSRNLNGWLHDLSSPRC